MYAKNLAIIVYLPHSHISSPSPSFPPPSPLLFLLVFSTTPPYNHACTNTHTHAHTHPHTHTHTQTSLLHCPICNPPSSLCPSFLSALNTDNMLLKIQLFLVFSAICKHSKEGLEATLDALDYYKVHTHLAILYTHVACEDYDSC